MVSGRDESLDPSPGGEPMEAGQEAPSEVAYRPSDPGQDAGDEDRRPDLPDGRHRYSPVPGRDFGDKLNAALDQRSCAWLSDRLKEQGLDVDVSTIRRWTRNANIPRNGLDVLPALSRALRMPMSQFIPEYVLDEPKG